MLKPETSRGRSERARGGFTLVEVCIAGALLALVLGSIGHLAQSGQEAFRDNMLESQLRDKTRRTALRITSDLRSASIGGLQPAILDGTGSVTFQKNEGWNAGAIVWGPDTRIAFEYAPGEINNGIDDDGNGLVDDGQVVWTLAPGAGEQRVVLARGVSELAAGEVANGADDNGNGLVDEPGLSFELVDRRLVVRLSIGRPLSGGNSIQSTAESAVVLKN